MSRCLSIGEFIMATDKVLKAKIVKKVSELEQLIIEVSKNGWTHISIELEFEYEHFTRSDISVSKTENLIEAGEAIDDD